MKIVVYTLGCKVNQYESDGILYNLKKLGYEVSSELEVADVYILNSCAVTNEAEKKSRQTIAKFKELNPNAKIIVCGCASQKNTKQFSDISGVTFVTGTANKLSIVDSIEKQGVLLEELPLSYNEEFTSMPTKTRAHIKIQDGCNNFCSYCIIPYLRGRSRSRDLLSIIKEIDTLSKVVKEIVITGINITDYKIDGQPAFDKLVEQLKPYSNVRFRLGSIEQGLITEKFIKAIKEANICPHFHLSLQSGADSVLKRMNRKYTSKDYAKTISLLKKHFDNPCITTDIIVGFPEETEAEFLETYNFAKKMGFYNIHIFPYSVRSGTVAEKMPQLDGKVKRERAKKLAELNLKLNKKYINSCKNKVLSVLVEENVDGYFVGHTENYIKCYINSPCKIGEIVKVYINEPYLDGAKAKIIE